MEFFTSLGDPPELGARLELCPHDVGFGGEGVCRLGGFVVFVPGAIPGEKILAEITEIKKQFARGRLIQVIDPSPDRTAPGCRHFGLCGGCQYQHIRYERQLEIKRKQVADLLQRIGKLPPRLVDPVVPCPQPYGYRNRIMIRSQWNKPEQRLNIGFLEGESRLVVDVDSCPIAEPALNAQIQHVRQHPPPKGGIKLVLRIPPENWEVPKDSFFQNNFFLLPRLVEGVRGALTSAGSRFLIDLFCGVGFFAIELAESVEAYCGVELDRLAIRAARLNASRRNRQNGEFLEGRAEEVVEEALGRFPPADTTIILDPPRTGCRPEMIERLRQWGPRQVIYVSCHPATLSRDLNSFCSDGVFDLRRVVPLDMFPQTQHVECVADLRSGAGDGGATGAA
ncbi:MAG: class I SAM-dependent RNA methyltransferase [Verrucomicrobia bacterium]|nr:class I SAM-dependent RNA methyltransferase [Verrucomicrobiota bacterium]